MARQTTWSSNQALTASSLNAEFDEIYSGNITRTAGVLLLNDDIRLDFGSSNNCRIEYDTTQTNDTLLIGVDVAEGGRILIVDVNDMATNFALAARTNPSVTIHSADATTAADYIELFHDQTDAVINVGAGSLNVQLAGTTRWVFNAGSLVAEGATDDAFETTISITDPTADRTITIPDGNVTLTTGTSVVNSGTPANNQVATWAGATSADGSANLTHDGNTLTSKAGTTGTQGLVVNSQASATVDMARFQYDGTTRASIYLDADQSIFRMDAFNAGNNVQGPEVAVQRNSNAGAEGPAAGTFNFGKSDGVENFIWVDTSANPGVLRLHTARPTGSSGTPTTADTAGTVVGAQTSWHELKDNIVEFTDYQEALDAVLSTKIFDFDMAGNHHRGLVIHEQDLGSWFSYNDDLARQQMPCLDERTIIGYLVASVKQLHKELRKGQANGIR